MSIFSMQGEASTSSEILTLTNLTALGISGAGKFLRKISATEFENSSQIITSVIYGGVAANDDITIEGTSHATKTTSYVILQPTGGNVGIGTAAPTAVLHLKAGTAAAGTAPLAFTSGDLLTTPIAGRVEFLTDKFYGTITTDAVRKTFAFLESPSFVTRIITPLVELGHNTDTTLSRSAAGVLAVEGIVVPTISSTNTLTNKRINPREQTEASSATPTPTSDTADIYTVTALAENATFAAPSGTPVQGQKLMIRIKDNATARTLAWNAIYRVIGVTLPTTTVISKTHYIGCVYNHTDTKWDVLAVGAEA